MKTASDRLLLRRKDAERLLHLSRNSSYAKLPRSRFKGMVAMADVRRCVDAASRNGAKWGGGELVEVDENALGVSRRSLFRALKKAPHFRISRKTALVEEGRIEGILSR